MDVRATARAARKAALAQAQAHAAAGRHAAARELFAAHGISYVPTYKATRADGTTVRVTVPPLSCRACAGEGRHWNGRAYTSAPCETCGGSGDDPVVS